MLTSVGFGVKKGVRVLFGVIDTVLGVVVVVDREEAEAALVVV